MTDQIPTESEVAQDTTEVKKKLNPFAKKHPKTPEVDETEASAPTKSKKLKNIALGVAGVAIGVTGAALFIIKKSKSNNASGDPASEAPVSED